MTGRTRPRKQSRRVAWPEPGRESGGEFRLTWGRIAAIGGILVAIPSLWQIAGHYMNKDEITQAMEVNRKEAVKSLKEHAQHDDGVQAWNQYGFASNRLEFLDDKQFECDAKKLVNPKLKPDDAAICAHYETKQKQKQQEASELKGKAMESTKEKPQ